MELREGDPAGEIVAAAREDGADLVIMGSRGHTGVTRLVLGGVAHAVLTHAPCSVLIVRDHHRADRLTPAREAGRRPRASAAGSRIAARIVRNDGRWP